MLFPFAYKLFLGFTEFCDVFGAGLSAIDGRATMKCRINFYTFWFSSEEADFLIVDLVELTGPRPLPLGPEETPECERRFRF